MMESMLLGGLLMQVVDHMWYVHMIVVNLWCIY